MLGRRRLAAQAGRAWLGAFGIARRHGERWVGAQGRRRRRSGARKLVEPAGLRFEHGDHRGMRDEADRADLARGAAQQRAGLERGAVGGELEQRGTAARADDLEEAEAVDRGPLERLRQDRVDRLGRRPGARPCRRRSAGRCRSSRRCRGGGSRAAAAAAPASASSSGASVPSTSIRVIAGVGEMRSSPPAKATMPLRASSSRSDQPAASSSSSGAGKASVAAVRAWRLARRLVADAGQRPLPRLAAGQALRG